MPKKSTAKAKQRPKHSDVDSPINEPHSPEPSSLTVVGKRRPGRPARGTGLGAAGQSGALQGLPRTPVGTTESVEELLEEGQAHEAEFVSGVENAPEPDKGEVRVHKVPIEKDRE
jgi:hypothetical protein